MRMNDQADAGDEEGYGISLELAVANSGHLCGFPTHCAVYRRCVDACFLENIAVLHDACDAETALLARPGIFVKARTIYLLKSLADSLLYSLYRLFHAYTHGFLFLRIRQPP